MIIRLRKIGLILVGGALATIAALPANADDNCMQVRGKANFENPEGQPDCSHDGETFDFCFRGRTHGTLQGTWTAFGMADWFVDLPASAFPVPPETLSNYNREFNLFTTRKGTLTGDAQYVFDIRIFDAGGGFVSPIIIDGGSGIFEGATGWIAGVFTNAALSRARLLGEICGPHIQGDDDSD